MIPFKFSVRGLIPPTLNCANMFCIFGVFNLLICLFSCNNSKKDHIEKIIEKYSVSDLRYFAEVCTNQSAKDVKLSRWRTDILYSVEGNLNSFEVDTLESVIATFNALSLPVKIKKGEYFQ
jgi:hypothetical protein